MLQCPQVKATISTNTIRQTASLGPSTTDVFGLGYTRCRGLGLRQSSTSSTCAMRLPSVRYWPKSTASSSRKCVNKKTKVFPSSGSTSSSPNFSFLPPYPHPKPHNTHPLFPKPKTKKNATPNPSPLPPPPPPTPRPAPLGPHPHQPRPHAPPPPPRPLHRLHRHRPPPARHPRQPADHLGQPAADQPGRARGGQPALRVRLRDGRRLGGVCGRVRGECGERGGEGVCACVGEAVVVAQGGEEVDPG